MDSIDKSNIQKDDTKGLSNGSDHSLDRHVNKKTREKGAKYRKTEKPISSQKSPFKSKCAADKQYTRTPFGHSGLSPKSFSRRHIQDSSATFYAKPTKLGKIGKELTKQSVEINLTTKSGKSLKRYSPVRGSNEELHPDEDQLCTATLSASSSSHFSSLDKNSSRSPDNKPRHRKCYTNSKHAEFAKHLKLQDKGLTKEIKITQSVNNLKRSGNSNDEHKIDSINGKDDNLLLNQDFFPKVKGNIYRNTQNEQLSIVGTGNPLTPKRSEIYISPTCTNVNNLDLVAECDQARSNLNYFCKGTDNKMNLEGSDISGVKILLRGDLIGALNCLFPQLHLVASETNPKRPILDPNFSYFSESSDILIETFALARKTYNEQRKKFSEWNKSKDNRSDHFDAFQQHQTADTERYNYGDSIERNYSMNLRNILSAQEIHTSLMRESNDFKHSDGHNSQNILKYSQSEPKITDKGTSGEGNMKASFEKNVTETGRIISTAQECFENYHNLKNMSAIDNNQNHDMAQDGFRQSTKNFNKRCLYSAVLKNSMFKTDFVSIEPTETHTDIYPDVDSVTWRESSPEMLTTIENTASNESESNQSDLEQSTNMDSAANLISYKKSPICYDLDELEREITKSLEKIIDEPEEPVGLSECNYLSPMHFYGQAQNFPTEFASPQGQKFDEPYHRKAPAVASGINSLESRLNFLRTKGRPSDFEQFFNPVAFNTQLNSQFAKQENIAGNLNATKVDNYANQLFCNPDLSKMCISNQPYMQPNPANSFERDIKELLTRYPQIMQNTNTGINQHPFLNTNPSSLATNTQFDFSSLYSHLAGMKSTAGSPSNASARNNTADENVVLNQFITSQSLDNFYPNNTNPNPYQMETQKFDNPIPSDYGKFSSLGKISTGVMEQNRYLSPFFMEASSYGGNVNSGIRTIISVSDLEKQALEQYRNSEESINARYDVLEKEAEEQYNNYLSQK